MPLRERDLAGPVAGHFAALGYRVFAEVGIARRWADLVAIGPEDVVAVELKLRAWREALRQATAYQLGVDRAYVAMPLERVQEIWGRRYGFEREGIGLLAVDARRGVREAMPARRSPRLFPPLRTAVSTRLALAWETVNMLTVPVAPPGAAPPSEDFQIRAGDHEPSDPQGDPHALEAAAELEGVPLG